MWKGLILRRRTLGRTSVREVCRLSTTGLVGWRNDQPQPRGEFDITIRWGCTSNAPTRRVLNTAHAIRQVQDKAGFRMMVQAVRPDLVPRTWVGQQEFYNSLTPAFSLPARVVVRPSTHAQGRSLYVCDDVDDLSRAAAMCGPGHYISELFPKTHEYRVFVVQGKAAWVAEKTPGNPDDVAWNVARGGKFDNVRWGDWNLDVVRAGIDAFNFTELDFGGVDVMWKDDTAEAKVLEINSAPSQTSPYRQECTARAFDYIMRNETKDRLPTIDPAYGWRDFIHPGVWSRE